MLTVVRQMKDAAKLIGELKYFVEFIYIVVRMCITKYENKNDNNLHKDKYLSGVCLMSTLQIARSSMPRSGKYIFFISKK